MVEERGSSPYAPSNEKLGGRIIYKLNGPGFAVRGRRDDAYEQMHGKCGGDYRILGEQDVGAGSVSVGGATAMGNSAFGSATHVSQFVHIIDFECGGERPRTREEHVAETKLPEESAPPVQRTGIVVPPPLPAPASYE